MDGGAGKPSNQADGTRAGFRASVPVFLPTLAIGMTFGLLAEPVIGALPAFAMSAPVWSGTGLLANARYLPMGFAIAPDLHARPWRRATSGALLADPGRFGLDVLFSVFYLGLLLHPCAARLAGGGGQHLR